MGNLAIVRDSPRMRTGTALVVYEVLLDGGISSIAMSSVLGTFRASNCTTMKSIVEASGRVTLGANAIQYGKNWSSAGSFFCLQYILCKVGPAFPYCKEPVAENDETNVIQIEMGHDRKRNAKLFRYVTDRTVNIILVAAWPIIIR